MRAVVSVLVCLLCFSTFTEYLDAQETELEIDGGIKIGDVTSSPEPGTIRWTGGDFEGWNGEKWVSLTGYSKGTVTDIDGNVYRTVKIGPHVWTIDNLRVTRYYNGEAIEHLPESSKWPLTTQGAYCWYDNFSSNEIPYGKLYNWWAVQTDKLCPSGWHVATDTEWDFLAMVFYGKDVAGGFLKETGTSHWYQPNSYASNESGFTALPGGIRYSDGGFANGRLWANYWSRDLYANDVTFATFQQLAHDDSKLYFGWVGKNNGCSVRCVKD